MKSIIISLFVLFVFNTNHAQVTISKKSTETIINETVWTPFKKAYETRDWEAFNALHTDNILRVHDGGIQQGLEYKKSIRESYQKKEKRTKTIDFIVEKRTYTYNLGYEVGFYRVIYQKKDKEPKYSYGRFHVVLKKINDKWKIAQDWDSGTYNGQPIGKDDFDAEKILNLSD